MIPASLQPNSPLSAPEPGDSLFGGAGRLLAHQLEVMQRAAPGAGKGGTEALHDLRVALRRAQALLRAFDKQSPQASPLAKILGAINRDLGQQRDLDVWIAFLERVGRKKGFNGIRGWHSFLNRQRARRQSQLPQARRSLRDSRFAAAMKTLARIVRTELPVRAKIVAAKPFALFAALHLRKLLRKACQEDDWQRDERRKTIHRARSRIRHARYLAELFASALCPETAELAERLHVVEQNLGRAHDMDRAASFLEAETASAPRPLIRQIARRRKQSLRRAADALDQLRRKKFEKGLKRSAKKARLAGRP